MTPRLIGLATWVDGGFIAKVQYREGSRDSEKGAYIEFKTLTVNPVEISNSNWLYGSRLKGKLKGINCGDILDGVFYGCKCSPFHYKTPYLMGPFKALIDSALHPYLSIQQLISKFKPSIAYFLPFRKVNYFSSSNYRTHN